MEVPGFLPLGRDPFYRKDQIAASRERNAIAYELAMASGNGTMSEYKHECLRGLRKDAAEFHAAGSKEVG